MLDLNIKYIDGGNYYCGLCEARDKKLRIVYSFYDLDIDPPEEHKKMMIARHIDKYHSEENKIRNEELNTTFAELDKAVTQVQIQLDWISSTIDDLRKILE